VLGQHLDDLAESFLMSALHNGQMRTMKANYKIEAGDLSVIRPCAYVRELSTKAFAREAKLPVINENCPACFEQPKERARVKQLLAQEESMVPALFFNLKRALMPLMHDDVYEAMAKVVTSLDAAGKGRLEGDCLRGKKTSEDLGLGAEHEKEEREVKRSRVDGEGGRGGGGGRVDGGGHEGSSLDTCHGGLCFELA
jgi:tRNA(Ile)-lysidine synthase TilS/MesJ